MFTTKERKYLTELLMAELYQKKNRQLHAASHNSDFYDPDFFILESALDKIMRDSPE